MFLKAIWLAMAASGLAQPVAAGRLVVARVRPFIAATAPSYVCFLLGAATQALARLIVLAAPRLGVLV
jgi:hypothetical protein